jgi:Tfp pilus assembly protein PilF
MSLLMQALRKAERVRAQHGNEHEPEQAEPHFGQDAVPSAPPMEGGPAFAVMPDAWKLEPLDGNPPVIPAQEAAHDPVPPQARHEPTRATAPGADVPRSTGVTAGDARAAGHSPVRAGLHPPSPPRAVASSQRRLVILVSSLALLLAVFALLYWRALSGPGPGASLPRVPMPAPGSPPLAQPAGQAGAGIAVTPYVSGADGGAPPPAGGAVNGTGAAALGVGGALAGSNELQPPESTAAPATRPNVDVTVPTPEQLAAIPDPAIRAEAMRDAAERAARQARAESGPGPAAAPSGAPVAASMAPTENAAGRDAAAPTSTRQPAHASGTPARSQPARPARRTGSGLQTAVGENGDVRFVRGAAPASIAPAVQSGYNALRSGDLAGARRHYDQALLQDPNNRDALLGAAAVALRENDGRQASSNYLRLLELDPNDPEALAGLAELRPGDLEANEIKLKGLARQHPDSGPVQFALGNLFARQGRWSEAQQSYFRAFNAMPDNADYAFNLGVGLDRMNQPRLAQNYYRRALELAQSSQPGFDPEAVRKRLQDLEAPPQ